MEGWVKHAALWAQSMDKARQPTFTKSFWREVKQIYITMGGLFESEEME